MSKKQSLLALILSLSLALGLGVAPTAAAQSPSPKISPSPKASASPVISSPSPEQTTQKLKERIERVVEEKREQIKGVLAELSDKKRGFIGEIQRVSEESITLKTRKATHIIAVADTLSITKQGKTIKTSDIAVGDWAIAIGSLEDDEFKPERLLISSTSLLPAPKVVALGTVSDINKTKLTVITRLNSETKEFLITKTTKYQDLNGTTIKATEVTSDLQVLVVGQISDKGTELKVVRVLAPIAENKNQ
jgi:hypothetical protein